MRLKLFAALVGICIGGSLVCGAASVTVQAESGTLGTDWAVSNSASPVYIAITNTGGGDNPGSAARVATYSVTFSAAGTYHLYARVRVGSDTFNDDSFFYASSFGTKSPTAGGDWVTVNGLGNPSGFNNNSDVVTGGGTLGGGLWKWLNLSLRQDGASDTPVSFTVSGGNLTQTFEIGARENGLDLDNFVFGTADYTFTVAELDAGGPGTPPPPPPPPVATIDTTKTYQTIEGLGGAICFYNGWFTAHPYKEEIYSNAFAGLNLSMLRLGNWFRYQGTANFDTDAREFVAKANSYLGRSVPVYMSSWAPPAFLKNNGRVDEGGSLIYTNGGFAYSAFAQYWYDALLAYGSNGVSPTWISIQNEPDWVADYDSCIFKPTEEGTNYASYAIALDTVYQRLTNLPAPPKLLAPEVVHVSYNTLANYAATMNANSFYGVAHHLYGDGGGTGDSFLNAISSATNVFPNKPRFMTEYGDVFDMIECAILIHNSLVVESVSGYNHWNLLWPGATGGLIQIENPWSQSTWTNAPAGTPTQSHGWWYSPSYWSMKHFSYFIQPGYQRVNAADNDNNVRSSAYLSPDGLRLVVVLINTSAAVSSAMNFDFGTFSNSLSSVYQTANTNYYFQALGAVTAPLQLPPRSLTTVVLDKFVAVGAATNPTPTNTAPSVALNITLNWSPGSHALMHAVYLGLNSNAVFTATTSAPEFKGFRTNSSFGPSAMFGGANYYWRVDEIAGGNTNPGVVWSFSTGPVPALAHRYSFSETSGPSVADSVGGPGWAGTLPGGGTFSSGQLTLASNSQQYVSLPAGIVSTFSNCTIEVWARLNSSANWSRIFDFGNNTTSYLFLTPQNGSNSRLRFAITTNGPAGERQIDGPAALAAGVWYHLAVTFNGNTGILYLNGLPVGTNNTMTLKPASLGNTVNNYIGKSQWADPYFNGLLDEFRIHSVALSASEIAATFALGPSQVLSTNSPAISLNPTPPNVTLTWPLASAGYTLQSRTNLATGNWVNVTAPAPQIISGQWRVTLPIAAGTPATFYRLSK